MIQLGCCFETLQTEKVISGSGGKKLHSEIELVDGHQGI
jgi:hypothetical protein